MEGIDAQVKEIYVAVAAGQARGRLILLLMPSIIALQMGFSKQLRICLSASVIVLANNLSGKMSVAYALTSHTCR
jgi:hypothetical protein